jgi:solute carrier family 6 amino acid transporter-like protein 5/7/9/14
VHQSDEVSTGQDDVSESDSKRETWGSGVEFLFSCIAMSVGLGNVWRFPFIAFKNGGGAFLLPYLIVLYIIGKPAFFLEMVVGQFSSRGATKVYDCCPAMRGVGTGQVLSLMFVVTYYSAIIGLILKYLVSSFTFELPWATCRPEWGANCISSASPGMKNVNISGYSSSAELFFR